MLQQFRFLHIFIVKVNNITLHYYDLKQRPVFSEVDSNNPGTPVRSVICFIIYFDLGTSTNVLLN